MNEENKSRRFKIKILELTMNLIWWREGRFWRKYLEWEGISLSTILN